MFLIKFKNIISGMFSFFEKLFKKKQTCQNKYKSNEQIWEKKDEKVPLKPGQLYKCKPYVPLTLLVKQYKEVLCKDISPYRCVCADTIMVLCNTCGEELYVFLSDKNVRCNRCIYDKINIDTDDSKQIIYNHKSKSFYYDFLPDLSKG